MPNKTIMKTNLQLEGLESKYVGKVREVYRLKNNLLVMVATDRLSAFDVVLPKGIPRFDHDDHKLVELPAEQILEQCLESFPVLR